MSTAPLQRFWPLVLVTSAIMMITLWVQQSPGFFVSLLNTSTGLTTETVSLAMAMGQVV